MFIKNFLKHKHLFDFSNNPEDSKFFDPTNKKVIGEFVGLKSKIHSMKIIDGKESNMAKGLNLATEFNEFKDTLFNKEITRKKNEMGTYEIDKISLSCFDDKRIVLDDGIHTLAYFHKRVKRIDSHR